MTREPEILAKVRLGRAPDARSVAEVVDADAVRLGIEGSRQAAAALSAQLLGLGPLAAVTEDERVTDVLVNGDGSVWVDRGGGLCRAAERLDGPDATRRLAVRLAGQAGRRLDESQPWVDGQLASGIRLHAILPPLADAGTHISLRVPRRTALSLPELQQAGMVDGQGAAMLLALVARRVSFVISGGTGTGKTTLLGALLGEVPPAERIVLVEDVRELAVAHPHVVRLQARAPNVEGTGEVTLVHLVRQALRMRPDRLVVGEVRGAEVRELLAAMNTGHEGGCGTVHANRPEDVPVRFEALAALAGLSRSATQAQLASAVQVVVQLRRTAQGRFVESLGVVSVDDDRVAVQVAARWTGAGWAHGHGWAALRRLLDITAAP